MLPTALPRSTGVLLSAAAAVLVVIGTATPTNADTTTKSDPLADAPPRLDIASVTYRNATASVSARVRVPQLTRVGRAEFAITTTGGTDVAYVAILSSGPDGKLRKRFVSRGNAGDTNLGCGFGTSWDVNKNLINIAVPRRCISNAGAGAHYLRIDMTGINGQERDYGPPASHFARD